MHEWKLLETLIVASKNGSRRRDKGDRRVIIEFELAGVGIRDQNKVFI
jgi:hypothetical protein